MSSYSAYGATIPSAAAGDDAGSSSRLHHPPQQQHHRRSPSDLESLDLESLERENFDLKMRLFYLEEKTAASAGLPSQLYASMSRNAEMERALQQAESEVEGKNALLLKARSVIESLQSETMSLRSQAALAQASMSHEINGAVAALQAELQLARQQQQDAVIRKQTVEEELAALRLVLSQMENGSSGLAAENARLIEQIRELTAQLQSHQSTAQGAQANHASLQDQLHSWKDEIAAREEIYRATTAQLSESRARLEDLSGVATKLEESQTQVHALQMQLQALQAHTDHQSSEMAHQLSAQQSKFEAALAEDDRRLNAAFSAEKEQLSRQHSEQLQQRDEATRTAFAELQDAYAAQRSEDLAAHEAQLASLRADFEAALARQDEQASARAEEAAARFEAELHTKSLAFDLALREATARAESDAARAAEETARAHAAEVAELVQSRLLLQTQLDHAVANAAKDLDQSARIHALQISRLEDKIAEVQQTARVDAQKAEAALRASLEGSAQEREAALVHELDFMRNNVVRVLRSQLETLEATLQRDFVPLQKLDEALTREAAAKEEARSLRAKLAEKQEQLDRLRGETVPLSKLAEAEESLEKREREVAALQAAFQRVQAQRSGAGASPSPRGSNASASPAQHASPILQLSMYPSSSPPAPAAASPLSPQRGLRISPPAQFSPSTATAGFGSAQVFPLPSPTAPDLKPALRKLGAENRSLQSQVASLRARLKEQTEEIEADFAPKTTLQEAQDDLAVLEARTQRRDREVKQLRELLVYARFPPGVAGSNNNGDAIRELGSAVGIEIRDLSPASSNGAASLSPRSPASRRSPSQASGDRTEFGAKGTASNEEAAAEVSRLTRALKARGTELLTAQSKLRALKDSFDAMRDSSVDRSVASELESGLDAAARDLAARDTHINGLTAQLEQYSSALVEAEGQIHELRQALSNQESQHGQAMQTLHSEATEHVRSASVQFESELAQREREAAQKIEDTRRALEAQAAAAASEASVASTLASARHSELESGLSKAQAKIQRLLEEKNRLEAVITSIAEQVAELNATAEFRQSDHPPPPQPQMPSGGASMAATVGSPQLRLSHSRAPSQSPARNNQSHSRAPSLTPSMSQQRRGMFSPSGGLFSPAATAAASPFAVAFASPAAPLSPSAPQSALAIAPQVTSIAQSLQSLLGHAENYAERLGEYEAALAASEAVVAEMNSREQALSGELEKLKRDLQASVNLAEDRAHAIDNANLELQSLRPALASATDRVESLQSSLRQSEDSRSKLEQKLTSTEAALAAAPTAESLQLVNDRVHMLQVEVARLEQSLADSQKRLADAESERAGHVSLRLAHAALQETHDKLVSVATIDAEDKRVLSAQLDQARSIEADNALLQQRLQQAERRTQIVGADQQLNVQVTRRVLVELCEVLHAAKIPASSQLQLLLCCELRCVCT